VDNIEEAKEEATEVDAVVTHTVDRCSTSNRDLHPMVWAKVSNSSKVPHRVTPNKCLLLMECNHKDSSNPCKFLSPFSNNNNNNLFSSYLRLMLANSHKLPNQLKSNNSLVMPFMIKSKLSSVKLMLVRSLECYWMKM